MKHTAGKATDDTMCPVYHEEEGNARQKRLYFRFACKWQKNCYTVKYRESLILQKIREYKEAGNDEIHVICYFLLLCFYRSY